MIDMTQEMCDKAIDALKFVPDWFVKSKMNKKLHTALYADDYVLFLMKILVMSHFAVKVWVFLL